MFHPVLIRCSHIMEIVSQIALSGLTLMLLLSVSLAHQFTVKLVIQVEHVVRV